MSGLYGHSSLTKCIVYDGPDLWTYCQEFVYQEVTVIEGTADKAGVLAQNIPHDSAEAEISCPSDDYATFADYRNAFDDYNRVLL